MNKERQLIRRTRKLLIDRDLNEDRPLDILKFINKLQTIYDEQKYDEFYIDYEIENDGHLGNVELECYSYETTEEYERRLNRQETEELFFKEKRRKRYLELREEFKDENI